ncbi:Multidrug efflux pump subunit AcrB [Ferrimonas sediminum]|uniref:Multidrug efflux pump subunit AcrB n=1 Tax=Ferrimonas sediminum TaxID=718193 RepID=A0A1G8NDJ0_9GAMM|nr:efflux RND transporter permease subunit [Ferrimonas sediminum]SDI78351.1 Multidrug efflux pump subunit AcrB [Ferrimonas sediminum]
MAGLNLAEFSIRSTVLSVIVILLVIAGGWNAYQEMPRLEDPDFTIREAPVITLYPGASPEEVAEEVTDPLEQAIQEMQEVDTIESISADGYSEIKVNIKYEFSTTKDALSLVWTKLRNKVRDAQVELPPGTYESVVVDDFGDVYGLYYLITGEGFSAAELRRYAKALQNELLQVEDVAKVSLGGEQSEAIYVEISRAHATALGVSINTIYDILQRQNAVSDAGTVKIGDLRVTIYPSGTIDSVEAIRSLQVSDSADGRVVYLRDIANVWRGYQTPRDHSYRYNGQEAIAIGISGVLGSNIVKVGQAIDAKLAESTSRRPWGIEVHQFYHQGQEVANSVQGFVTNVVAALAIVVVTLFLFMGFKSASVIGAILLLTIAATLATMQIGGIPMHRISLGALIIALGMMVDNAIVVTEGILVGMQKGARKLAIAKSVVAQTQWPLLGGTLVGIIAFAPIGFAPGDTAEYTGHLFWVILISLMYSWLFALTLTPLFCYWLFKEQTPEGDTDNNDGAFTRAYKASLKLALKLRLLVCAGVVALFIASVWGFQFVKEGFFPASTSPQMVVDYWLPQGSDIDRTYQDLSQIEAYVRQQQGVVGVTSTIGAGGLRYMLIYAPESPNDAYGQLLIRLQDYRQADELIPRIQNYIDDHYPNGQAKVWRFVLGPGGGSKIEATFKGSDRVILRQLADQAKSIMIADGGAMAIQDDWRQPISVIEPIYSDAEARRAGINREDLAAALLTNFSGRQIGTYREFDDLIPIIARAPALERVGIEELRNIQVLSSSTGRTVPITQVTDDIRTVWRNGQLRREDRIWTIKAQSDPLPGDLASDLLRRIRPQVEAIALPDGYSLEWDGEFGDSSESQQDLASTIPLGVLFMVIIVFVLFGSVRQPLMIWLVVPLALIGVVAGLLLTRTPMEFMGILGLLSLSGLLIKNAIVLVDQIDLEISDGKPAYQAIVDASASRVRPVMMGALTTVLGVLPLYADAFFRSMSVVLVGGLSFATVLTLILIPVLYALFFRVPTPAP